MGQKLGEGGCAFFSGGSWVHIEHNVAWAEVYLRTKWYTDAPSRLATIDISRNLGGEGCAPFEGGARSPSDTMSPEPRPISLPTSILIDLAIWPQ